MGSAVECNEGFSKLEFRALLDRSEPAVAIVSKAYQCFVICDVLYTSRSQKNTYFFSVIFKTLNVLKSNRRYTVYKQEKD